jgi:hypothetical protein
LLREQLRPTQAVHECLPCRPAQTTVVVPTTSSVAIRFPCYPKALSQSRMVPCSGENLASVRLRQSSFCQPTQRRV